MSSNCCTFLLFFFCSFYLVSFGTCSFVFQFFSFRVRPFLFYFRPYQDFWVFAFLHRLRNISSSLSIPICRQKYFRNFDQKNRSDVCVCVCVGVWVGVWVCWWVRVGVCERGWMCVRVSGCVCVTSYQSPSWKAVFVSLLKYLSFKFFLSISILIQTFMTVMIRHFIFKKFQRKIALFWVRSFLPAVNCSLPKIMIEFFFFFFL